MSVKVRPYRRGGWEVDIMITLANGDQIRRRYKAPVSSKSGRFCQVQPPVRATNRPLKLPANIAPEGDSHHAGRCPVP